MKIIHIAFIALAVAAPLSSANAGHSHRGATVQQRNFVAHSGPMEMPAARGPLGAYAAGEDSSTSVNWRKIGGF